MSDSDDEENITEGTYVYWMDQDEDIPRNALGEVLKVDGEKRKVQFPNYRGRIRAHSLNASDIQKGSFVHLTSADAPLEAVGEVKSLDDGLLEIEFMGDSKKLKPTRVLKCDFQPGMYVFWSRSDKDILPGHLGEVVPGLNDQGKVKVKFPAGSWRFRPSELVRAHVQRRSFVQWTSHDDDIAQGEIGQVVGSLNDEGRMKA
eukprot:TRINITY_DN31182_c0_g1_i1.p1 TRINITY_DN31182_c0_g1~~TRINITY_DN31182_c0_g1_i1.p1  ORF type:complete len:202 (+),score=36.47 TRINITY_DN31182_c0_g1_i1:63-668(+)